MKKKELKDIIEDQKLYIIDLQNQLEFVKSQLLYTQQQNDGLKPPFIITCEHDWSNNFNTTAANRKCNKCNKYESLIFNTMPNSSTHIIDGCNGFNYCILETKM